MYTGCYLCICSLKHAVMLNVAAWAYELVFIQPDSAAFREYCIWILYEVLQMTKSSKLTCLKIEYLLLHFRSYRYAVTDFGDVYITLASNHWPPPLRYIKNKNYGCNKLSYKTSRGEQDSLFCWKKINASSWVSTVKGKPKKRTEWHKYHQEKLKFQHHPGKNQGELLNEDCSQSA